MRRAWNNGSRLANKEKEKKMNFGGLAILVTPATV